MYFPALGSVKLSVLFFYRRVFNKPCVFQRSYTGALIILATLWSLGFFFSYLFLCKLHPWYDWANGGNDIHYCINQFNLHLAFTISDFLLDLFILSFPIPLVCSICRLIWPSVKSICWFWFLDLQFEIVYDNESGRGICFGNGISVSR